MLLLMFMFLMMKIFRLIFLLLSFEFLFISLLFFFMLMNKLMEYYILIFFGIFSSLFCILVFLKYVIYFGSDFVKF